MKKTNTKKSSSKSFGVVPLHDRVLLVEVKDSVLETKSGIIIPDTVSDDKGAKRGKVVAVGEGRFEDGKRIPLSVKVGDIVLFQWGDNLKINGEEYFMVNESGILAVIK